MLSPTGFSFRWVFCISEAPDLPKFSSYQKFTKTLLSHGKKNNINYWHERKGNTWFYMIYYKITKYFSFAIIYRPKFSNIMTVFRC